MVSLARVVPALVLSAVLLSGCSRDAMVHETMDELTELTKQIQGETDQAKRQAMIDEAFKIHAEEVGHIPLHQQPLSWGVSDNVSVIQRPDNVLDLRYVQVN